MQIHLPPMTPTQVQHELIRNKLGSVDLLSRLLNANTQSAAMEEATQLLKDDLRAKCTPPAASASSLSAAPTSLPPKFFGFVPQSIAPASFASSCFSPAQVAPASSGPASSAPASSGPASSGPASTSPASTGLASTAPASTAPGPTQSGVFLPTVSNSVPPHTFPQADGTYKRFPPPAAPSRDRYAPTITLEPLEKTYQPPVQVNNPYARKAAEFRLFKTALTSYEVTPPAALRSKRVHWAGPNRIVCRLRWVLAENYGRTQKQKVLLDFCNGEYQHAWVHRGTQLHEWLGMEQPPIDEETPVCIELLHIPKRSDIWEYNHSSRIDCWPEGDGPLPQDVGEFNSALDSLFNGQPLVRKRTVVDEQRPAASA